MLGSGELGDEWSFDRIGTDHEKMQVEKEIHELRQQLAQVDEWKKRHEEIESELADVWTDKGEFLDAPEYIEREETVEGDGEREAEEEEEEVVTTSEAEKTDEREEEEETKEEESEDSETIEVKSQESD